MNLRPRESRRPSDLGAAAAAAAGPAAADVAAEADATGDPGGSGGAADPDKASTGAYDVPSALALRWRRELQQFIGSATHSWCAAAGAALPA